MRVLVAMSGGVDSSVAAALLARAGPRARRASRFTSGTPRATTRSAAAARPRTATTRAAPAEHLGFPHYVIDERSAFRSARGGALPRQLPRRHHARALRRLQPAREGHAPDRARRPLRLRARRHRPLRPHRARATARVRLLRGRDLHKDQSYFLYGVPDARARAARASRSASSPRIARAPRASAWACPTAQQARLAGAVLRARRRHRRLRRARAQRCSQRGEIRDASGAVVGEHQGIYRYTVGQRKGLGLGGGPARYVLRVLPERQGRGGGRRAASCSPSASRLRSAPGAAPCPREPFEAQVRVRYRARACAGARDPAAHRLSGRVQRASARHHARPGRGGVSWRRGGRRWDHRVASMARARPSAAWRAALGSWSLLAARCSVGHGEGDIRGTVAIAGCRDDGPLRARARARSSRRAVEDLLRIRVQRGSDLEVRSDGLAVLVDDAALRQARVPRHAARRDAPTPTRASTSASISTRAARPGATGRRSCSAP